MNNSVIEINKKKVIENYKLINKVTDSEKILVIKSNGYGHGIENITKILINTDVKIFGVASLEEAKLVRKFDIERYIFIFNDIDLDALSTENLNKIILSINNKRYLREIIKKKHNFPSQIFFHLKVNTGMNRFGFEIAEVKEIVDVIETSNLHIEGIYSHLADCNNYDFSIYQKKHFDDFLIRFEELGIKFRYKHIANSGGIFLDKQFHYNMVRPGMALYGLQPLKTKTICVLPVLNWKSYICEVREINKPEYVGYFNNKNKGEISRIGIIPVGYADGYLYQLSKIGKVCINGNFYKIVGNISMEHIFVDISNTKIEINDIVYLLNDLITPKKIATLSRSIQDDIVTKINSKIKRVIV